MKTVDLIRGEGRDCQKGSWCPFLGIAAILFCPLLTGCYVLQPTAQVTPLFSEAHYACDVRASHRNRALVNASNTAALAEAEFESQAADIR